MKGRLVTNGLLALMIIAWLWLELHPAKQKPNQQPPNQTKVIPVEEYTNGFEITVTNATGKPVHLIFPCTVEIGLSINGRWTVFRSVWKGGESITISTPTP